MDYLEMMRQNLKMAGMTGINNKEEFAEMAESLKTGRHSSVYKKLAEGKAVSGFEEEAENLKLAKKTFKKDKLIGETLPNMLIWDLGRP